ncbi:DUF5060 domain-containing protein [Porifericola rhodea]|uniref:DUF5060 domain-containing protein n=1 Tax=Porifericola rhodea TaxID=930972 RepID=UPI00266541BD|nr:DUF5060 domain-containing protein [Porifericola rhodea]WKN30866.1 DUF5060 domain-containing protein [Porifericola rhodea]
MSFPNFSKKLVAVLCLTVLAQCLINAQPLLNEKVVFEEKNGVLAVEAEHFFKQSLNDVRQWYIISTNNSKPDLQDPDEAHLNGASNNAYLELLPDTRSTHDDPLIQKENFTNEAGAMAVLHYKVHINKPGRYYVWVRCFSTGTEDNGLHVGLDGQWPDHGQRMQWTAKNQWFWDNKQRTEEVHTGVPMQIYLDIDKAGEHEIMFSMREDGFEFDKWMLVRDKHFRPEQDHGPTAQLKSGSLPPAFLASEGTTSDRTDGTGEISISGELKQWHKVTLNLDGPFATERDESVNPFTDYNMRVTFTHESGSPSYTVPGYFAADGHAAESSAEKGTHWRAHVSPDKIGRWDYEISFTKGKMAALIDLPWSKPLAPYHGKKGSFKIVESDKNGQDFRSKGRLEYVGKHHLQFQGSKEYFLKAGSDAPETLLAFADFDNTKALKKNVPLKKFEKHISDWKEGDLSWKNGKGQGLVGALNYLSSKGLNAFSFLTYNAGGDGDNIWPFVERDLKYHYDCSKLDQWQKVFEYAQSRGLYLHFKLQETENDDNIKGHSKAEIVKESLDGGELGPERRLYLREMIARFGYLLALNWNLGEENTQTTEQRIAMAQYISELDPYKHNIVIHTYPDKQDDVYPHLLGTKSEITGASLQNSWNHVHKRTLQWLEASAKAGKPWVVANDEQGSAKEGVPPDPDYPGFDESSINYDLHDIRKQTLWANLMAGGAGVEYYFGYSLPENDLVAEDFRSRDQSWDYCRIALNFFKEYEIPFWEMNNHNKLIGNEANEKDKYCLAKENDLYLVYLGYTKTSSLDLTAADGTFEVMWFNPRTGGKLRKGKVKKVKGGGMVELGSPPAEAEEDWLVMVKKQ